MLTFDDITDQLSDQRRAAWSDIAQRIAHEIKNPLTPIQLAAERLQRRYGAEVTSDPETFARLTDTIVRQVGDLRRMVDEFSNFARMPKPVFERANVHDIARAALFLHEVAHPGMAFSHRPAGGADLDGVRPPPAGPGADQHRQECGRGDRGAAQSAASNRPTATASTCSVRRDEEQLVIDINDTGVGLPEERERLTEPYMTTRVRGTGLGLAIVKKIVEEHLGEIAFLDRPGGGTHVRIAFDAERLEERADVEAEPRAGRSSPDDGEYDEED